MRLIEDAVRGYHLIDGCFFSTGPSQRVPRSLWRQEFCEKHQRYYRPGEGCHDCNTRFFCDAHPFLVICEQCRSTRASGPSRLESVAGDGGRGLPPANE